jgi:N-sulfoglucosamine sulfohydrolase
MAQRPNIIIISCHDIGQHLGCYGVNTVRTPSIDRLAAEGVRFADSFCTAPQCSPSRASIYTGRFPHSNGVMGLVHAGFAWDLHADERHLAAILQDAGYRTGLVGTQHETRRVEDMGFTDRHRMSAPCEDVAGEAIRYLNAVGSRSEPFYLQVGFIEPHRRFDYGGARPDDSLGITIPAYLVDEPSAREEFAQFQGIIRKVDAAIGTVLDSLAELPMTKNTITIFTADHGIPFPRAKCSLYDPGIQVPFIVRWPYRGWTGGRTCGEMISNIDYLPTLLEAIGIPVPRNVQGRSFASLLDGSGYDARSEVFAEMTYHDYYDPRRCIRTPDHKLIANFSSAPFFMDPSQTWRQATITVNPVDPTYAYHPDLELYDLRSDPLEFENVADQPEYAEARRSLATRLNAWMSETGDPLLDGIPPSPQHLRTLAALRSRLREAGQSVSQ